MESQIKIMSKVKNPIRKFINQAINEGLKQMYCGEPWADAAIFEAAVSELRPCLCLNRGKAVLYIEHPAWDKSFSTTPIKIASGADSEYYDNLASELDSLAELCRRKSKRAKY